jgi:hypothetical protein
MELSNAFFGHRTGFLGLHTESPEEHQHCQNESEESALLYDDSVKSNIVVSFGVTDSWLIQRLKNVLWYILAMPVWCAMACAGKKCLTTHVTEMALQTPHPIRIGNVRFARAKISGGETRVVMLKDEKLDGITTCANFGVNTKLLRADSLPRSHSTHRMSDGKIVALPELSTQQKESLNTSRDPEKGGYQSLNQKREGMTRRQMEEEKLALEDDPQQDPPSHTDFLIAVFYVIFGVIAMAAGLLSIFV